GREKAEKVRLIRRLDDKGIGYINHETSFYSLAARTSRHSRSTAASQPRGKASHGSALTQTRGTSSYSSQPSGSPPSAATSSAFCPSDCAPRTTTPRRRPT